MKKLAIELTITMLQVKLELLELEYHKTWLEIQDLKKELEGIENE